MNTNIKYFVIGHTSNGKINLIESNLKFIEHVILLNVESNKITTQILQKVMNKLPSNISIEVLCSTNKREYIDGIIIRQLSLAIITKNVNTNNLRRTKILNLNIKNDNQENINKYIKKETLLKEEAYTYLKNAFDIHQHLEKIFISEMDFSRADQVKNNLENKLFANVKNKNKESVIYKRFFGTNTSEGIVNQIDNLISSLQTKIFLKGRAGTGKSYLMKRIMEKGIELGLDIEVYLCSLDPKSIDMIIVRELGFCILDSTYPHEYDNIKEDDLLIDMYELAVKEGTEEKYIDKVNEYKSVYKSEITKGINRLKETKSINQNKELLWEEKLEEKEIDLYFKELIEEIEKLKI